MQKILFTFSAVLLLIGAGCAPKQPEPSAPVVEQPSPAPMPTPPPTTVPAEEPAPTPDPTPAPPTSETGAKTYTMSEVAAHADATSCWTAVNGSVYDVTTWISKHPGGSGAIMLLCGKDGTTTFNAQHGGSAMQESRLASFKIGTLK